MPTATRQFTVKSSLGDEVLLFRRLRAREHLSQLFEFEVELLSTKGDVKLSDVLGQPMTVSIEQPSGGTRYLNGIVSRFGQTGTLGRYNVYQATLRPWLWLLTRMANCRIFQNMKTPDIILQVFRDCGFTDFKNSLSGSYPKWEYRVQYRETAFNFVSRLMEQEGIYYYFEHADGKHTLVLCDDVSTHQAASGYDKLPFYPPSSRTPREEHVFNWLVSQEIQSGKFVSNDYNFETPSADLAATAKGTLKYQHSDGEVYDYPGQFTVKGDGQKYVQIRQQEREAPYEIVSGQSTARGLVVGNVFELEGYSRNDQNRKYLVLSTDLDVQSNEYESGQWTEPATFACRFTGMKNDRTYRAPETARKPFVQGPQTAVVVGKSGEEIYTDKYGRVKLQFFWDRLGKKDENSSCWVRVAQHWAGKQWGTVFTPRIGQEVMVDFLEGDPDRPIVTGRVYNAEQMPPYTLPDNMTQSGIKTRSTKQGTADNFNELRFEDKEGSEQIFFHAEKDFVREVENNDSLSVGSDKADDGSQTISIWKNRTETVKTGNETVTIEKGNRTVTVKQGNDKHEVTQGTRDVIVQGNDTHEIKQGNRQVKIDMGNDSLTISIGNQTTKLNVGSSSTEAMQSIELKVGASSVKIDQMGVTIKGMMVSVQGQVQTEVKGTMTSIKGDAMLQAGGGITMIG